MTMDVTDNFKSEVMKDKLGMGLFGLGCLFLLLTTYIGLTEIGMWYDILLNGNYKFAG